jgi:FtsH-binding integral membrane protein
MNYFGLLTGILSLLIIGLGFPLVIQTERRLGYLWWPYMLGLGILIIVASLFIANDWLSVIVGVLGATFVWGSTELKAQAIRARLGWFPGNIRKIQPPFANIIKKWQVPYL